jgi:hypothetical protein
MNLPDHIVKKSDNWFLNTKSGKFIHVNNIEAFCNRYWANRKGTKKAAVSYKKNVKMANRRWNDE